MPRVMIAALPADRPFAREMAEELTRYISSSAVLPDEPQTAMQNLNTAGAMVILIGEDWLNQIEREPVLYDAITQALSSNMLTHIALLPGCSLPPMMELPEPLRPLAYIRATEIHPDDTFASDVRRIGVQLAHHLKRMDGSTTATTVTTTAKRPNRGLPWHILIIVAAIMTGIAFVIIPNLREDDRENPLDDLPQPISAAQNAAIINQQDGLMIAVGAGLTGQVASRGETMVNGVRLALVSRPNVTVAGQTFPIDMLTQDSGCSSEGGIQAAQTFTTDSTSIVGVVGHMCNASCFTAASIYNEEGLAMISPGCDATGLTLNPAANSFNRTVPSQSAGAADAAAFAVEMLNAGRVVVISDEEVTGTEVADVFAAAVESSGGEVAARITLSSRTLDLAELTTQIDDLAPDLIFFGGRAPAAAQIITAIPAQTFMLANTVDIEGFIAEAGDAAEGVLTYTSRPATGERIGRLNDRYTDAYDGAPDTLIYAYSYDATNMLLDAVEAVGTVDVIGNLLVDRDELRAYLRSYEGDGITGAYDCDGTGNCADVSIDVLRMQDGTLATFSE